MKNFIIPAIDLINGKCVRLFQGDYSKKTEYKKTPLEMAKDFEKFGIKKIHLVDLDGAKKGEVVNYKILEEILKNSSLKVEFGGGIRDEKTIEKLLKMGVFEINIGSLAVKNFEKFKSFVSKFGEKNFTVGVDCLNGEIKTSGWLEGNEILIEEFLQKLENIGIKKINITDIGKDGTLDGPNFLLYKSLIKKFPNLKIIASAGVSCFEDLKKLKEIGCDGTIVGKAIYEGKIKLEEL